MAKNIQMNYFNGSSYEELYPYTTTSLINAVSTISDSTVNGYIKLLDDMTNEESEYDVNTLVTKGYVDKNVYVSGTNTSESVYLTKRYLGEYNFQTDTSQVLALGVNLNPYTTMGVIMVIKNLTVTEKENDLGGAYLGLSDKNANRLSSIYISADWNGSEETFVFVNWISKYNLVTKNNFSLYSCTEFGSSESLNYRYNIAQGVIPLYLYINTVTYWPGKITGKLGLYLIELT